MKSGFTLSELLVALSIVGIIAAVTVPTMVGKYQKTAQALQIKKVYSDLQQNLTKLQTENYKGTLKNSKLITSPTGIKDFFMEHYKIEKDCEDAIEPCFASSYMSIDNSDSGAIEGWDDGYAIQAQDGSAILMNTFSSNSSVSVLVDTNGPEPPNIAGRDLFQFTIYDDYSIDVLPPAEKREDIITKRQILFDGFCLSSRLAVGCFGQLLNDDFKMNY